MSGSAESKEEAAEAEAAVFGPYSAYQMSAAFQAGYLDKRSLTYQVISHASTF